MDHAQKMSAVLSNVDMVNRKMSEERAQPCMLAFKVVLEIEAGALESTRALFASRQLRLAIVSKPDTEKDALTKLKMLPPLEAPVHGRKSLMEALVYAWNSVFKNPFTFNYKGEDEEMEGSLATRLVFNEFAHALNRRHILHNDQVDPMIEHALSLVKS